MSEELAALTPSEINAVLKEACGSGLFPFADAILSVIKNQRFTLDGHVIIGGWGEIG